MPNSLQSSSSLMCCLWPQEGCSLTYGRLTKSPRCQPVAVSNTAARSKSQWNTRPSQRHAVKISVSSTFNLMFDVFVNGRYVNEPHLLSSLGVKSPKQKLALFMYMYTKSHSPHLCLDLRKSDP